jgi:hypothetical protein
VHLENYLFSIHYNFINAEIELHRLLDYVSEDLCRYHSEVRTEEYTFEGYYSRIICSMYMTTIINLCSSLDILVKIFCELVDFPVDYSEYLRFRGNGMYFKDIGQYNDCLTKYPHFRNPL